MNKKFQDGERAMIMNGTLRGKICIVKSYNYDGYNVTFPVNNVPKYDSDSEFYYGENELERIES